jgi:uncharacterized protein
LLLLEGKPQEALDASNRLDAEGWKLVGVDSGFEWLDRAYANRDSPPRGRLSAESLRLTRRPLHGDCNHEERKDLRRKPMAPRPPLPPFTRETAIQKVRLAEDAWNSRDPEKVSLAYTLDSRWRNRSEFVNGRAEIVAFLTRKWSKELDYRLIKELWAFNDNRIAVRFAYEWHDDSGNWYRSYGNENWEFDRDGLMQVRHASINDLPIRESDHKYRWPLGRRPAGHPELSELGL